MNIDNLKLFIDVVRQGSFAEVARSYGVAPSSISRSIAGLENELGIRLFHRSTRKLEPTEAGKAYFDRINPVIYEIDAARQFAMDISEEPKGTLRITAPSVFGETMVVPLLPELAKAYPLLSIELILTDAYLDLVEERIDVAIRLGTLKDSTYIAKCLTPMTFHICASPDYIKQFGEPRQPHDIRSHNCLLFPRSGYSLNWLFRDKSGAISDIPIHGKYLITSSNAIKQCAVAGMGLALLPDWLIRDDLSKGGLVELYTEYETTATDYESAIWLLYSSREYLPLKSRVFIDYLTDKFH